MTAGNRTTAKLFSPITVGSATLRNRIVLAPHSTHFADRYESEHLTEYYRERAEFDVGLIIHEPVIVHPSSLSRVGKIWGYDEGNISHYRRTTSAVHSYGSKIICQLIHNGREVDGHQSSMPAWYPSAVSREGSSEFTHEMTIHEVREVVEGFARSARICMLGGFDGVEIHAAHGYLIQGFLSPATNQRSDRYGGCADNRYRILKEIIYAVRENTRSDFVIGIRLSGNEYQENGLKEHDTLELARSLATDEVDYFSIVSGSLRSYARIVPDMSFEAGLNVPIASRIREVVAPTPVLVTGRISDPARAEEILSNNHADLIGMARSLIADPEWARKAAQGAPHEIRPCVYANDCRGSIGGRRALSCMVNPEVGTETRRTILPTTTGRRVVVVGGGVAGMECSLTAAEAGAEVVLVEKSERLGGQLHLAAAPGSRKELRRLVEYLARKIEMSTVQVRLGEEATAESVRALDPDAVVVATGAEGRSSRFTSGTLTAWDVLSGRPVPEGTVVVFDESGGNGWPFLAAAELLTELGRKPIVVSSAATLGSSIESASIPPLAARLRKGGAEIHLMTTVLAADRGGVRLSRHDSGAQTVVSGASLVVEAGRSVAAFAFDEPTIETIVVGDALAPRRIQTAIRDGREAAIKAIRPSQRDSI